MHASGRGWLDREFHETGEFNVYTMESGGVDEMTQRIVRIGNSLM